MYPLHKPAIWTPIAQFEILTAYSKQIPKAKTYDLPFILSLVHVLWRADKLAKSSVARAIR